MDTLAYLLVLAIPFAVAVLLSLWISRRESARQKRWGGDSGPGSRMVDAALSRASRAPVNRRSPDDMDGEVDEVYDEMALVAAVASMLSNTDDDSCETPEMDLDTTKNNYSDSSFDSGSSFD